jgi:hypothetical protein
MTKAERSLVEAGKHAEVLQPHRAGRGRRDLPPPERAAHAARPRHGCAGWSTCRRRCNTTRARGSTPLPTAHPARLWSVTIAKWTTWSRLRANWSGLTRR